MAVTEAYSVYSFFFPMSGEGVGRGEWARAVRDSAAWGPGRQAVPTSLASRLAREPAIIGSRLRSSEAQTMGGENAANFILQKLNYIKINKGGN